MTPAQGVGEFLGCKATGDEMAMYQKRDVCIPKTGEFAKTSLFSGNWRNDGDTEYRINLLLDLLDSADTQGSR